MPKFEVKVSDRRSDWREAGSSESAAMQSQSDSTTAPTSDALLSITEVETQLCIPEGVAAQNCITVT